MGELAQLPTHMSCAGAAADVLTVAYRRYASAKRSFFIMKLLYGPLGKIELYLPAVHVSADFAAPISKVIHHKKIVLPRSFFDSHVVCCGNSDGQLHDVAPGVAAVEAEGQVVSIPWMIRAGEVCAGRDANTEGRHQHAAPQLDQVRIDCRSDELDGILGDQHAIAFDILKHL